MLSLLRLSAGARATAVLAAYALAACSSAKPALNTPTSMCALPSTASTHVADGSAGAGVQVVLYHDLLDPTSQSALMQVADEVSRYPKTAVRLVVRQLPQARTGKLAATALAALAAECRAPGGYFLHAGQSSPAAVARSAGADAAGADSAGADSAKLLASTGGHVCEPEETLAADMASALALGAFSAPALYVNGQRVDDIQSDVLMQVIANEVRHAQVGASAQMVAAHIDARCGSHISRQDEAALAVSTARADLLVGSGSSATIPHNPGDRSLGAYTAPVTLVGFFCLDGPDCQREFLRARRLQAVFGNDQVRLVWKDLPRRAEDRHAHEAAWGAAQHSQGDAWAVLLGAMFPPGGAPQAPPELSPADNLLQLLSSDNALATLHLDEQLALARTLHLHAPGALFANGRPLPPDFAAAVLTLRAEWQMARAARRRLPDAQSLYLVRSDANAAHLAADIETRKVGATPWPTYAENQASVTPAETSVEYRRARLAATLSRLQLRGQSRQSPSPAPTALEHAR